MFKQIGDGLAGIGKRLGGGDAEAAKAYLAEFERFEYQHPCGPSLGEKAGITTSSQPMQLYVTEKLFAHNKLLAEHFSPLKCKDAFKVELTKDKTKKTTITGKTANVKDRVIVCSQEGDVMAVVIQEIHVSKQFYQLLGTKPLFPNQRPINKYHHESKALFACGKINTAGKKWNTLTMDLYTPQGYEFESLSTEVLDLGGVILAEKPILVKKLGHAAAVLRQGHFPDGIGTPAWSVSVAPGIDPLLILGLIAVMDTQVI